MTGKRILTAILLALAIMTASACGKGSGGASNGDVNGTPAAGPEQNQQTQNPPEAGPVGSTTSVPRVIDQKKEVLPDPAFLSTYPGVLDCMSLSLEQILKVLGSNFQLFENTAQGYDVYYFSDYNLTIEYDTVNEKLSSVRIGDTLYNVYSGAIKEFDIDNDGKPEEIAAYEDENLNGKVTVFGQDGLIKADQTTAFFDGQCVMYLLSGYGPEKESLIVLDTKTESDCEVFSYSNGNLISMLPPDSGNLTNNAEIAWGDTGVDMKLPEQGTTYECPVPQRLLDSYPNRKTPVQYDFAVNLRPVVSDKGLSLLVRHNLQVRYYEDEYEGGTNTSLDIAQITEEYQYLGGGKWEKVAVKGGSKYNSESMPSGIHSGDFTVGMIKLLEPATAHAGEIGLDLSKYTENDIISGVLYKTGGVSVGITNDMVSFISLEKGGSASTSRGLKTGDSRQQALDLYGLPDKGYFEDSTWTYYFLRRDDTADGSFLSADNLNIEFEGDRVSRIWMSMYIPVY